jgi:secondary thiamine-phosphate synthase enzyme
MTITDGRAATALEPPAAPAGFVAETRIVEYQTGAAPWFLDVTDDVLAAVTATGVRAGQATVFSQHTTAAICINENEPLLLRDLARVLRSLAPPGAHYDHNDFEQRTVNMTANECANGHSHCQHLFLRTSETIPIVDGVPALGLYQRVFLVELDHPRPRRILVSVVGIR